MNKQELIEKYKNEYLEFCDSHSARVFHSLWDDLKKLDEPQEVPVPQFAADYIKYAIENDWDFQDLFKRIEDEEDEELLRWVYHERNQETLAAAWINGYTVEKEKRYRVKMKNAYYNKHPQFLCETDNGIFWAAEIDLRKTKFTRKELEEAGFGGVFNSPLFEVEEAE